MKVMALFILSLVFSSSYASAQSPASVLLSCEDHISWCDSEGKTVAPTPIELARQCELFPSSCKDGQPIELADSGCVEESGWLNFCTDTGKLRDPTPAELEILGAESCTDANSSLENCNNSEPENSDQ